MGLFSNRSRNDYDDYDRTGNTVNGTTNNFGNTHGSSMTHSNPLHHNDNYNTHNTHHSTLGNTIGSTGTTHHNNYDTHNSTLGAPGTTHHNNYDSHNPVMGTTGTHHNNYDSHNSGLGTTGTHHHGITDNRTSALGTTGTTHHDNYDSRHKTRGSKFGSGGGGLLRSKRHSRSRSGVYNEKGHREKRALFDMNSGNFNRRPSFGQWLKFTWLDILTMIILGAIGLGVYEADPAPTRSFPITFSDGEIVYPQFAYPLRKEIIPIWAAALIGSLVPIFVFLVMQIRIKSFWDVNNAVIGLLYSLITAAVFQVFIKWLIGGLRPHFLTVCQPDVTRVTQGGDGFRSVMYTADVCTGDRNQINDSLESMPSGHSTAAFAGLIFLYLYLNAKLKVFSNHHPAMWKLVAVYAPVLGACLIAGSLTIDEFHNWYDCLAGAVIGTIMAFSAYRMVYASVWDFRFNHIPLTRHTPFSYGAGSAGAGGFETAVFTHTAGWGFEEAYGGAPFDAAHHLRGGGGMGGGLSSSLSHRGRSSGQYRSGDLEHHGVTGSTTPTDNRYRSHRKSLERKAIPSTTRADGTL